MSDPVCQMCGKTYDEHLESRPPGDPVPKNGCTSLRQFFVARIATARVAKSNWIKLKRGNDWGVDYFAIEPLGSAGTASKSRGIKLLAGEPISIRMPDGAVLEACVVMKPGESWCNDQGRDYRFITLTPIAVIPFHGMSCMFNLDEVEVDEAWARSKGAQ